MVGRCDYPQGMCGGNEWIGKQRQQLRAPSPEQTMSRGVEMLS
jgi:hypothetical protein